MIKVLEGQSLPDIAVRESGSAEAVFDWAVKNGISVTDRLRTGMTLAPAGVKNRAVAAYYKAKNLYPATGMEQTRIYTGIGAMGVDINFTVS
jgi:hypothetical protein